jgi:hypothetical protein
VDAFSVAAQMLGELELGPGQLAELRAIDSKYHQRLYTLLHASELRPGPDRISSSTLPWHASRRRRS